MDFKKDGIDAVFLHLFEALSAITKRKRNYFGSDTDNIIKTEVEKAKNRIIWKTVRRYRYFSGRVSRYYFTSSH